MQAARLSAERVQGALSPAADIYSLGCLLWEMLHASPIWHGHTPGTVLKRVVDVKEGPTISTHIPVSVEARRSPATLLQLGGSTSGLQAGPTCMPA